MDSSNNFIPTETMCFNDSALHHCAFNTQLSNTEYAHMGNNVFAPRVKVPLKICTSKESQTENSVMSENIFNCCDEDVDLPKINISFGEELISCLLDTGSSISVLDKNFFESVKQKIKYKHYLEQ